MEPRDWHIVAGFLQEIFPVFGDRSERIVVDFAARDNWQNGIEKCRECSQNPGLRLSPEAEQNEIVAAQEGVDDLWHHGFFVSHYALEYGLSAGEAREKIRSQLIFDGAEFSLGRGEGGALESAKCFWVERQRILRVMHDFERNLALV
jgi:hypothetical protein